MKLLTLCGILICVTIGSSNANELTLYGGRGTLSSQTNYDDGGNYILPLTHGGTFGGQLLISIDDNFSLGLDVLNSNFGTVDKLSTGYVSSSFGNVPVSLDLKAQTKSTVALFVGKASSSIGLIKPYLIGGFGFYHNTLNMPLTATLPNGFLWGSNFQQSENVQVVNDSATGFACSGGVGFDVPLNSILFIGTEARMTYLSKAHYNIPASTQIALGYQTVDMESLLVNFLVKVGIKF